MTDALTPAVIGTGTDALRTVTDMLAALADVAMRAALNPETPPTMLPQVLGTALRATLAVQKVAQAADQPPLGAPSPPDVVAPEGRPGWLPLPPTGHNELPDIMPPEIPGPPWAPWRGADPEHLDRLNRHMAARRTVWLRERAAEMAALLCDSQAIHQVELDLAWVRGGGDPADIQARWAAEWKRAMGG